MASKKQPKVTKATLRAYNRKVDKAIENARNTGQRDAFIARLEKQKVVVSTDMARVINADKAKTKTLRDQNVYKEVNKADKEAFRALKTALKERYGFTDEEIRRLNRKGAREVLSNPALKNRNIGKNLYGGTPTFDTEDEIEEFVDLLMEELELY